MKSKKLCFNDKDALVAYLSHFWMHISKKDWKSVTQFYKEIGLFVDEYPNHGNGKNHNPYSLND